MRTFEMKCSDVMTGNASDAVQCPILKFITDSFAATREKIPQKT